MPSQGEFTPHALGINSDGVLIAAGYDEERNDCGVVDVFNCTPYKMFRSLDKGASWHLLSNPLIAERHAFTKGDKVNPALLGRLAARYGRLITLGKKVIDVAAYADYGRKGQFFTDGKDFYLYIDFLLYYSQDAGASWQEVEIDYNYVLPVRDQSSIYFQDGYLFVHDAETMGKFVFRKNGSRFYLVSVNNFAILNQPEGRKKVFADGINLATRYYRNTNDKKSIMRRNDTPSEENQFSVAEFFIPNKKIILGNFLSKSSKTEGAYKFALVSKDNGKTFSHHDLPDGIPAEGLSGIEVIGFFKKNPVILLSYEQLNLKEEANRVFITSHFYYWDLAKNKIGPLVLPDVSYIDGNTGFYADFKSTAEYAYYYTTKGLFRIRNK